MGMTYIIAREYGAPIASFEDETMAVDYAEAISDKLGNRYTLFYVPHVEKELPFVPTARGYAALESEVRNGD